MSSTRGWPWGRQTAALVALMLMAMLWGTTFFSLHDLVERNPTADLLAIRFSIAAAILAAFGWKQLRTDARTWRQGTVLGILFGTAQLAQTVGLESTAASVSGFVTGLYVVFTPLLAAAVFRDRVPGLTWVAVALATVGLAVLSLQLDGGFLLGAGEVITLGAAVVFAAHIVVTGHLATPANALSLTIIQTIVTSLVCWIVAVPNGVRLPQGNDWWWVLYLAIVCGAVTIFLQMWAQAFVDPTRAAVIMAMEPVWAAAFAVGWGGESVTWRMVLGGGAIVAAMVLVVLIPALRERRRARRATSSASAASVRVRP